MGWPKGKPRSAESREKMARAQRARHGHPEPVAYSGATLQPISSRQNTYAKGARVQFTGSCPFIMLTDETGTVTSVDGDTLRVRSGALTVEVSTRFVKRAAA